MSYGQEPSNVDLESAASLLLGRLMVGWSRLEMALQLYLAALPRERTGGAGADWPSRLERLLAFADTLPDKALRADFLKWIVRARELAPLGEALRTARWLPDPRREVVLVLRDAPAAPPGRPSYTLPELQQVLAAHKELLDALHRLCMAERGLSSANAASFLATQPLPVAGEA